MSLKKYVPQPIKKFIIKLKRKAFDNKKKLTLKKICKIIDVEVPSNLKKVQNIKVSNITRSRLEIEPNFVMFCKNFNGFDEESIKKIKENALCVFSEVPIENCNNIVITKNLQEFSKIMIYIRKVSNPYVIAVTGSIGKTSTKDIIASVLREEYKKSALTVSQGNSNSHFKVAMNIKKLNCFNKVYLQEVGIGASRFLIKECALMLEPSIVVYTNILDAHIEHYKTRENIAKYKTMLSKYGKKDGLAIINYDDPVLRNLEFEQDVISYSIGNNNAMYYAKNIELTEEGTTFTLVDNIDQMKEEIKLKVIGEHHIYNALAAYALAKYLKIDSSKIKKGLINYKTTGMRGNLFKVGEYKVFADCYNASLDSIESAAKTLDIIKLNKKFKKIAVIADVKEMGEISEEIHRKIGENLASHDFQEMIFFGKETKYSYEEYRKIKGNVVYFDNREKMHDYIEKIINPGDLILFKGSHGMHLTDSIDMLFGTDMSDAVNIGEADYKIITEKDYEFYSFPCQITITKCTQKSNKITIPNTLEEKNITKLKWELFLNNKNIKEIVLPKHLSVIKPRTFDNSSLEKITFNTKLKGIKSKAFYNCNNLKKITLPKSLIYIEELAFAGCKNLRKVVIPETVQAIDKLAFKGSKNVVIYGKKESYVASFAKENNITFKEIK